MQVEWTLTPDMVRLLSTGVLLDRRTGPLIYDNEGFDSPHQFLAGSEGCSSCRAGPLFWHQDGLLRVGDCWCWIELAQGLLQRPNPLSELLCHRDTGAVVSGGPRTGGKAAGLQQLLLQSRHHWCGLIRELKKWAPPVNGVCHFSFIIELSLLDCFLIARS